MIMVGCMLSPWACLRMARERTSSYSTKKLDDINVKRGYRLYELP
jgi:hypothetical protein